MHEEVMFFLEHHGVKGQKWGVRKKSNPGDRDYKIRAGTKILNVSANVTRTNKGPIYGAHTKKDVLNYRGNYAFDLMMHPDVSKVFSNSFTVKSDLKVAGRKKQVETFKKLWNTDRETLASALAEAQKDMKFSAAFNARILKLDRTKVYHDRIIKRGEKWINNKGPQELNASLNMKVGSAKVSKARKIYIKEMQKRGYNAVADLNDIKQYRSDKPVLIFNGAKHLKKNSSIELTEEHVRKAIDAFGSQKILKEYRDKLH